MTPRFVLDAWAMLALLQGEKPAASRVKALLAAAGLGEAELCMSIINQGQVVYRSRKTRPGAPGWRRVRSLPAAKRSGMPSTEAARWMITPP
jgi:predicted nucleic acid-binding protein